MAYEYDATGERTKLAYPDGREVTYNYDEKLQLSSIIGNGEETRYTYNESLLGESLSMVTDYIVDKKCVFENGCEG